MHPAMEQSVSRNYNGCSRFGGPYHRCFTSRLLEPCFWRPASQLLTSAVPSNRHAFITSAPESPGRFPAKPQLQLNFNPNLQAQSNQDVRNHTMDPNFTDIDMQNQKQEKKIPSLRPSSQNPSPSPSPSPSPNPHPNPNPTPTNTITNKH